MPKVNGYTVYIVSKDGKPRRIASRVKRLEARKIVKNIPDSRSSFAGFVKSGKRVTNRSKFQTR